MADAAESRRQFLYNQVVAADPSLATQATLYGNGLEDLYNQMVLSGKIQSSFNQQGRVSATTLPVWTKKKTLSQLNQSPTRILCIGDSTTAGVYSDSYTSAIGTQNQGGPNSYPAQLASRLTSFGLNADYSLAIPGHSGNTDSRWTPDASWGMTAFFAAGNACFQTGIANAVLTLAPNVLHDTYKIWFWSDAANTFSIQATGNAGPTTVDSVAVRGANPAQRLYSTTITVTGAASTSNTLTIKNLTGQTFIAGVEFWNSATPNRIRVLNAGVGGSTTASWTDNGAASFQPGAYGFITALAPDLTIISLGINDAGASVSATSVMANIITLANTARLSGDVLLLSAIPHSTPGLVDSYNSLLNSSTYPYIDLQNRWKNSAKANGLMTTDDTHPNAIGYGDMATAVAKVLLGI